jgi:hypothetical protein
VGGMTKNYIDFPIKADARYTTNDGVEEVYTIHVHCDVLPKIIKVYAWKDGTLYGFTSIMLNFGVSIEDIPRQVERVVYNTNAILYDNGLFPYEVIGRLEEIINDKLRRSKDGQ